MERHTEHDEVVSNSNSNVEEQAKIQQLELKQQQMQQQMAQMLQMLSAQNGAVGGGNLGGGGGGGGGGGDSAYPCQDFGQKAFKRENPEPSYPPSSSASSGIGASSSNEGSINNNSAGTEHLTKEKLWDLYMAGRVTLDGVADVKVSTHPSKPAASEPVDSDIEEIVEEEEDPSREGFSANDWALVFDDGKICAILCEPCRKSGKEPIPIRGDSLDKLKSFGEQHLVFRHNHAPKGHPHQVGPNILQCKICKLFFRAEKLLERHSKTCVVVKKEPASNNIVPCKVELSRSKAVEAEVSKKRKLSAGGGGENGASDKRRYNASTKVEPGSQPESSAIAASKTKTRVEKDKPTKKNGKDDGKNVDIKSFFKASNKSKESSKNDAPENDSTPANGHSADDDNDDVPAANNDDDDEGYDGGEKNAGLPLDLITLGDRWHEGDRPEGGFACPLCKTRPLSRPIFIEDHVAAHHFKQKRYVCTICRKKNEEEEDEKNHVQCAWSHKSTLNEHLQKNHSLQFARQEKLNFKLMVIEPLHPDAVNTMRLFFKLYPKKGEKVKEKYTPKKPTAGDNNQKKSKCPECDQKFYTQEERTLIDHIMWRHRDAPRYHCHHCESDAGFGMVAGFEDHCKREHGCDKNDFVSLLLMKVDKVPEELAKQYYIDDNDYQDLHKGREVISDDEEDMPQKKEIVAEKVPDMKIGFRQKEMFFVCRFDECDWTLSSRELFLNDKINKHTKTHHSD